MRRHIPSTKALRCFESAAKHESFTQAAEELYLTQSAVSRQIKKLEDMLGCPLFDRVKQRLYLTDAGKEYEQKVCHILEQLEAATTSIRKKIKGRLRIGIEDSLMTHWLIPKLNDLQQQFPDIETEFISNLHLLYDLHEGFDIGILMGDGTWPDLEAHFLMPEKLVAICTPELLDKFGPVTRMKDVLNYPFLHHTATSSGTVMWLNEAGLSEQEIQDVRGPRFGNFKLLVKAAKEGLGLTIAPEFLVAGSVRRNELVMPFAEPMICNDNYYVVIPNNLVHDHKIQAFSKWLLSWNSVPESIDQK